MPTWFCRLGALVVGLVAGAFYLIPHSHLFRQDDHGMFVPVDPHADAIALVVVACVATWLLISLMIVRRRESLRPRLGPGVILGVVAGAVVIGASWVDAWPITTPDAALVSGLD